MLSNIIGFSGKAKFATARAGDVRHSLADITLAQKHLGYSTEVDFEEGLRRTVEWYQKSAAVEPKAMAAAHR